jgi:hypothetical protein
MANAFLCNLILRMASGNAGFPPAVLALFDDQKPAGKKPALPELRHHPQLRFLALPHSAK